MIVSSDSSLALSIMERDRTGNYDEDYEDDYYDRKQAYYDAHEDDWKDREDDDWY